MLLLACAFAAEPELLLLGNSYTQFNELHLLVEQALAEGVEAWPAPHAQALVRGGLTLADHADLAEQEGSPWNLALAQPWDFVLLQDQSQVPSFPTSEPLYQASLAGAVALDAAVAAQGGQTFFLLTWGRRDGDAQNPALNPDYATMQDNLLAGTLGFVEASSTAQRPTWLVPAGLAFGWVLEQEGEAAFEALYAPDGSHPSARGSDLAAYVIYASLTGRSPVGLSGPEDALPLQAAAAAVVLEQPFAWGGYPWAGTELPEDGRLGGGALRPLVDLHADASAELVLTDARLWLSEGTLTGRVSLDADSELELRGGSLVGEVDGDVWLREGVLESSSVSGSLWQSGGLLRGERIAIGGEAVLGAVAVAPGQTVEITASSFDLGGLELPSGVIAEQEPGLLRLRWALTDELPEPQGRGCSTGSTGSPAWALLGLLALARRRR